MPKITFEIPNGRLGSAPEIKYGRDNLAIAKLSIAVNQYKKDKDGEWEQVGETSWINAAAFGYTAELIETLELSKGDKVFCQGFMYINTWEDEDGDERKDWNFTIDRLFPIPATYEDDEDKPRKKSGKKKFGKKTSKKPSKGLSKFKKGKKKSTSDFASKILSQLGK